MKRLRAFILSVLIWCQVFCNAGETVFQCPKQQRLEFGKRGIVRCGNANFTGVYWIDNSNEVGASAFIQMEDKTVVGSGFSTREFDLLLDGSLVINRVNIQHENTYRVEFLNSDLILSRHRITVTVYVEPAEPQPVILQCDGKIPCIQQGDPKSALLCVHGNSRPAVEVSWFMRIEGNNVLLNGTTNQTLSAEAVTFTTNSYLPMTAIPAITNVNPLVLLVCKSNHPVTGASESHVLIDFSRKDPFPQEKRRDVHSMYVFESDDVILECHGHSSLIAETRSSVLLWMYKSLNNGNVKYLMYSAYGGVVSNEEIDKLYTMTTNGSLEIKQVDLTHEGYYACLKSAEDRTISLTHLIKVIVLPNPPTILVEGCELFQPCHLIVQRGESITCKVNGVHPDVQGFLDDSPYDVITRTDTESHRENGLFYTTIRGYVGGSKATCGGNVTLTCRATGPAANGFKSTVHITATVVGDCFQTPAIVIPKQGDHSTIVVSIITGTILLIVAIVFIIVIFIIKYRSN